MKGLEHPFREVEFLKNALHEAFIQLLSGKHGARQAIQAVAADVQALVARDADAALGLVHCLPMKPYNLAHPVYSALLCELIGLRLGYGEAERLPILSAALSCNLAALPYQERLRIQRGALSAEQFQTLRHHPDQSVTKLRAAGVASPTWLTIVKQHHERADGSGYPEGLKGAQILRESKLVALTDMYLAQVTERAHRDVVAAREALKRLFLESREDDAELCAAFVRELGVYPPGTWVRLNNHEIALVIRRGDTALTPLVRAVRDPNGRVYPEAPWRDTREPAHAVADASVAQPELIPEPAQLWPEARESRVSGAV